MVLGTFILSRLGAVEGFDVLEVVRWSIGVEDALRAWGQLRAGIDLPKRSGRWTMSPPVPWTCNITCWLSISLLHSCRFGRMRARDRPGR